MTSQKPHNKSAAISLICIFTSILYLAFVVFQNRDIIFEKFNAQEYKTKYEHSQWRVPNSKTPISDQDLYAYAGYEYFHGENPTLINPEVPPFGKYIIGIFAELGTVKVASLLAALGSLILLYFVTLKLSNSKSAAAFAVLLTSTHTLFTDQLIHAPQLEVFQLFFLLLMILFLFIYFELSKKLWLIFAGVVFGLFISIKIFILSFILINAWLVLYYILNKNNKKLAVLDLLTLNLIGFFTFTLTYFNYFLDGYSIRGFLGVQKWIYLFYSMSHIDTSKLIGNYLFLIFANHWRFWSEGYPIVAYERWTLLWPIIFVAGFLSIFHLFKMQIKNQQKTVLILSFFIVYNVFLFMVPIFPRY
ncbi:MAG: glycosyltransferase family 39 protein, partial [Patescibacteria group bacterium]